MSKIKPIIYAHVDKPLLTVIHEAEKALIKQGRWEDATKMVNDAIEAWNSGDSFIGIMDIVTEYVELETGGTYLTSEETETSDRLLKSLDWENCTEMWQMTSNYFRIHENPFLHVGMI